MSPFKEFPYICASVLVEGSKINSCVTFCCIRIQKQWFRNKKCSSIWFRRPRLTVDCGIILGGKSYLWFACQKSQWAVGDPDRWPMGTLHFEHRIEIEIPALWLEICFIQIHSGLYSKMKGSDIFPCMQIEKTRVIFFDLNGWNGWYRCHKGEEHRLNWKCGR